MDSGLQVVRHCFLLAQRYQETWALFLVYMHLGLSNKDIQHSGFCSEWSGWWLLSHYCNPSPSGVVFLTFTLLWVVVKLAWVKAEWWLRPTSMGRILNIWKCNYMYLLTCNGRGSSSKVRSEFWPRVIFAIATPIFDLFVSSASRGSRSRSCTKEVRSDFEWNSDGTSEMQICHLLVLSYVCLQALYPKGAGEEDNINPDDLARQLRSEICALNESQAQSFYRAKRDEENRDYQFPNPGEIHQLPGW